MARWRIGRAVLPLALVATLAGCTAQPGDDDTQSPPSTAASGDQAIDDAAAPSAGGAKRAMTDTDGADGSAGMAMSADEMAAREASENAPDGPLNMLSAQEAEQATDMAVDAAFVQDVVASALDRNAVLAGTSDTDLDAASPTDRVAALAERPSYRVLYTQRLADKGGTARAAEVGIYRYDTGEAIYAKVDLASGEVSALDGPPGLGIPLVREEIDEAATVARADAAVAERLTAAGLDPSTAVANGLVTRADGGPCADHRCVRLFFGTVKAPLPTFAVVVDLVTLQIVEVTDMPAAADGGTSRSDAEDGADAAAADPAADAAADAAAEPTADPMEGIQP